MEEFISKNAEKINTFKKGVTHKQACELIENLLKKEEDKVVTELKKLLLNSADNEGDKSSKMRFINDFTNSYSAYKINKSKETKETKDNKEIKENKVSQNFNTNTKQDKFDKQDNQDKSDTKDKSDANPLQKNIGNKTNTTSDWGKKLKIKDLENEFPVLDNLELVNRKKNYKVLDQHYENKLEKGIKLCNCMSKKHPLVGNCLNCGRIQCLQEGEKVCIFCGTDMIIGKEYQKIALGDKDMKKAVTHKDKLLKFQEDFYSKLQIIDDFSDWYELSNNTWLDKTKREMAKKNDDEIDRIRDQPNYEWKVDFRNLTIEKEFEKVDDSVISKDINQFYIEQIKLNKENKQKEETKNISCAAMNVKCLDEFSKLISKTKKAKQTHSVHNNPSIECNRIDVSQTEKFGDQLINFNKNLLNSLELMNENDNFIRSTDKGMCLSMHQPWASLVIEGIKRFEGREWKNDFRGVLWIHAGSKKPEDDTVRIVEEEYKEMYKNCPVQPKFPKRYPTSCLLGCVDLVDIISDSDYKKMIPQEFREKSYSPYHFVVKNPLKLDTFIKMPGDFKLFPLDKEIIERTTDRMMKVSTSWWPHANIKTNLLEMPFKILMSDEKVRSKGKNDKIGKIVVLNNVLENEKYSTIIQNFIQKNRVENLISLIETLNTKMTFHNNYMNDPYIQYGLSIQYQNLNDVPPLFMEIFEDIRSYCSEEYKIKMKFTLSKVRLEYIDWYGLQNFRSSENKEIKLIIGNSLIMSFLNDYSDINGKSIKLESTNILIYDKGYYYSISQVLYDGNNGNTKLKQGSIVLTFIC